MAFFDTFNTEFAAFKKANKTKAFKAKTTEQKAKIFLQQSGPELKKELEKAVKNNEKIIFSGLPNAAKNYFGKETVQNLKRKFAFETAILIQRSNRKFAFNEGSILDIDVKDWLKKSEKPAFIVVGDIYTDEEAREHFFNKDPLTVKTIKQIKEEFGTVEDSLNYPNFVVYALTSINSKKYCLFLFCDDNGKPMEEDEDEEDEDEEEKQDKIATKTKKPLQ